MSTSDNTPSQQESASQGSPDSTSRQQSDPSREVDRQRLSGGSPSSTSPEKRIATGAEELELSSTPRKSKQGEASLVAGQVSREVVSVGPARQEVGSIHNVPFKPALAGDKVGDKVGDKTNEADDHADIAKGASQHYRDRYVEVMRNFRAGKLHAVVTDRIQAKSIAAEQARQSDSISDQKTNR